MQNEGEDSSAVHSEVMQVVRSHFRPEFLNRIDEIILFHRLRRQDMGAIVDIQFKRLGRLLEDRKITLDLTEAGRSWLAEKGYDAAYGARPLKRVIQKNVQDPLAEMMLAGEIGEGRTVEISAADGELTLDGKPGHEGQIRRRNAAGATELINAKRAALAALFIAASPAKRPPAGRRRSGNDRRRTARTKSARGSASGPRSRRRRKWRRPRDRRQGSSSLRPEDAP